MKTGRAIGRNEELLSPLPLLSLPALQPTPQQHLGIMMGLENCVCFTEYTLEELDIATLSQLALKCSKIQISV